MIDPNIYGGRSEVRTERELEELKKLREEEVRKGKKLELSHSYALLNYLHGLEKKYPLLTPFLNQTPIHSLPEAAQHFCDEHHIPLTGIALNDLAKAKKYKERAEELEKMHMPTVKVKKHKRHDEATHSQSEHVEYLDRDKRYHDLLMANPLVQRLRKEKPELSEISSIAEIETGVFALNPELTTHFTELDPTFDAFVLEEAARAAFAEQYAEEAKQFAEVEKHRVYEDPENDPAFKRLKKQISQETNAEVERQKAEHAEKARTTFAYSAKRVAEEQIREQVEQKHFLAFARVNPQKTASYAESIVGLQLAWQIVQQEEATKVIIPPPLVIPTAGAGVAEGASYQEILSKHESAIPTSAAATAPAATPLNKQNFLRPMPGGGASFRPPGSDAFSRMRNPLGRFPKPGKKRASPLSQLQNAQQALQAAQTVAKLAPLLTNPVFWIVLFIILLLLLLILGISGGEDGIAENNDIAQVRITKTGPSAVPNPQEKDLKKAAAADITYKMTVSYSGEADAIIVTDTLDKNVDFISAGGPGNPTYDGKTRTVTWRLTPGQSPASTPSALPSFLPNPLPPDPDGVEGIKQEVLTRFKQNEALLQRYKEIQQQSGIPWQVFAGLHWREGNAVPGTSLTSGRKIGEVEPDRAAAGDCTGPVGADDGKADINCVFASPLDDALFAANHLKSKIGKTPETFEEIVQALSRYNGTGNVNCGQSPYTYCPPAFEAEDSPYTLNLFDAKHKPMYQIYCTDGVACPEGTVDERPGALTVSKWVSTGL